MCVEFEENRDTHATHRRSIPYMATTYSSSIRDAAAAEKKARVVAEATKLLRTSERVTAVSLDVVAKAAGVTRLTVYNQFGSRRGLLEAVLDNVASKAGFERIREVMALEDPAQALGELIDIVCRAWGYDESIASIHAAASIDPEFLEVVNQRMERRRKAIQVLVRRMAEAGTVSKSAAPELVDVLDAMTSYSVFETLRVRGRSTAAVSRMMRGACLAVVSMHTA